jgi:alpha-glucoside transport system substrate-binding protein
MSKKLLRLVISLTMLLGLFAVPALAQDDEGFDIMEMQDDERFSWDVLEDYEDLDLEGETVTIFGAFVDEGAQNFEEAVRPFEEATGIDVQYEGSGDFETLIRVRVEGGDAPDIAAFPQPGLFQDLSESVVPVTDNVANVMTEEFSDGWVNLATADGDLKGIIYRANVKSLVWYNPTAFADAGYEVPETWEEMVELSDLIVEDGETPWCIGIESSGATGWVVTDWLEDAMLRSAPPETYDAWVNHEISFNDEEVQEAMALIEPFFKNEEYVNGGTDAILTTPFGDAINGLFADDPECYLHRQASFIADFFSDDVEVAEDGDAWAFYLPGIEEGYTEGVEEDYGSPVLTAGDLFAPFSDDEATMATLQYLAEPLAQEVWAAQGGFVAPNQTASLEVYPTDLDRFYAELLQGADTVRFDASDLMPGFIGTDAFWTAMVNWVNSEDTETVLTDVEEIWNEQAGEDDS